MVKAYTQNLYASEVYRELERQAVRKGHFEPTPEELVRSAAHQVTQQREVNRPVSVDPSDDLIQDVARLAYAMRRKGYITQAEDLEQKLVIYKQAESVLYDVTSEKAQDYIDLAHSDGDYQVEGFGELGVVETVESAAAKIRAVVQKEPTGKFPGKTAGLSAIAELIRRADLGDGGGGGGDYAATIRADLEKEYKKVNDHMATWPRVDTLANQIKFGVGGGAIDLASSADGRGLYKAMSGNDPNAVMAKYNEIAKLGITGHAQTAQPFIKYLTDNASNPGALSALTRAVGLSGSGHFGVKQVLLNGRDYTGEVSKHNWTGITMPQLNGGSGLILDLTGRDSGPYINVTESKYVWDTAFLNEYANQIRQRYYDMSDQVFLRDFAGLNAVNDKLAEGLRALGSIAGLRVEPNPRTVTAEGEVDPGVAIQPVRAVRAQYDKITTDNKPAAEAIRIVKPDVSRAMQAWQVKFYDDVLTDVQTQIADFTGTEIVDVSQAISKLRDAASKWQSLAQKYLEARERVKNRDAMTNVRMSNRFADGLEGVGTPRVMQKPKPLLDAWMRESDFANIDDVLGFANDTIRLAEEEAGKLVGGAEPRRNA
jgi:hypothetical protein